MARTILYGERDVEVSCVNRESPKYADMLPREATWEDKTVYQWVVDLVDKWTHYWERVLESRAIIGKGITQSIMTTLLPLKSN